MPHEEHENAHQGALDRHPQRRHHAARRRRWYANGCSTALHSRGSLSQSTHTPCACVKTRASDGRCSVGSASRSAVGLCQRGRSARRAEATLHPSLHATAWSALRPPSRRPSLRLRGTPSSITLAQSRWVSDSQSDAVVVARRRTSWYTLQKQRRAIGVPTATMNIPARRPRTDALPPSRSPTGRLDKSS
jgi:hypothetical protein